LQEHSYFRQLSYTVVFGTLWGTIEMTAGGLLHALHVPFSGILLAAVGATILSCQRALFPVRGITLTTGCLAAGIKVFSMGGVYLNPLLAVLMEALLAECAFCLFGTSFLAAGLAGFMMGFWSFAQGLLTLVLLYGMHWIEASASALSREAPSWPVSPVILLFLAVLLLASLPASGGMLGLWSARRFQGAVPGGTFGLGRENV
jgi:hypothetical protein